MNEKISYNDIRGVRIYDESNRQYVTVDNLPNYFSMLFPKEAHRPQISLDEKCNVVKKFVIKIKSDRVK